MFHIRDRLCIFALSANNRNIPTLSIKIYIKSRLFIYFKWNFFVFVFSYRYTNTLFHLRRKYFHLILQREQKIKNYHGKKLWFPKWNKMYCWYLCVCVCVVFYCTNWNGFVSPIFHSVCASKFHNEMLTAFVCMHFVPNEVTTLIDHNLLMMAKSHLYLHLITIFCKLLWNRYSDTIIFIFVEKRKNEK